uniref:Uncharacterized protein n=1 Tax=Rhizophora mucronata TaxID=61149 RepID=A0A2P2QUL7_RHIMU
MLLHEAVTSNMLVAEYIPHSEFYGRLRFIQILLYLS